MVRRAKRKRTSFKKNYRRELDRARGHRPPGKNRERSNPVPKLSGLDVCALGVIALVSITTLWLTNSPEAAIYITIPLLNALGVWKGRHFPGGLG